MSWDVKSALKDSYYWSALETFWEKKSSLGSKVIRTIDNDTTDILSWCGDPSQKGAWKRRGLVMGHVQSGKTTNYSALIAKALDMDTGISLSGGDHQLATKTNTGTTGRSHSWIF